MGYTSLLEYGAAALGDISYGMFGTVPVSWGPGPETSGRMSRIPTAEAGRHLHANLL